MRRKGQFYLSEGPQEPFPVVYVFLRHYSKVIRPQIQVLDILARQPDNFGQRLQSSHRNAVLGEVKLVEPDRATGQCLNEAVASDLEALVPKRPPLQVDVEVWVLVGSCSGSIGWRVVLEHILLDSGA